jgi:peptidoglycan/xylan/chitin deacetylase (PgdA/CDA1 family)
VAEIANKLYLTFDVEDFINDRSLSALRFILKLLKKHDVGGLFFITGHMAEKLRSCTQILNMLEDNEIGYHSTSHSVHPNIFEYTDIDNYQRAHQISLVREVSHINPLTGEIEGEGGIELLREIFPGKRIEAFRAPGFSWSPPHLEALKSLGIKYDFSTNISQAPIYYRGVTFFPYPLFVDAIDFTGFIHSVLKEKVTVVNFHPNFFVNQIWWDSPFFNGNPEKLSTVPSRTPKQTEKMFHRFETFLRLTKILKNSRFLEIYNNTEDSEIRIDKTKINLHEIYNMIISWPVERFKYKPRFIRSHLLKFFEL